MAAVMSLSAHFPVGAQEPPNELRISTNLLSASGSFPILAALFVEEAVEVVTEMAVRMSISQSIKVDYNLVEVVEHVNPPKEEGEVAVPPAPVVVEAPVEDEIDPRHVYDGLDEEEGLYDYLDDDDFDYEGLAARVCKTFKAERRPVSGARIPLRTTNENKYPKVRKNKRYGHRLVAKMERSAENKRDNMISRRYGGRPAAIYQPDERRIRSQEERDIEEAIRRSRRSGTTTTAMTVATLMDLQNRELTPEDYELLLMLDETVEKKKVSKSAFDSFQQSTLSDDLDVDCPICMSPMSSGEKVTTLPCSHQYHTPCIEQWLTLSSPNCPLDGLSLLHDH